MMCGRLWAGLEVGSPTGLLCSSARLPCGGSACSGCGIEVSRYQSTHMGTEVGESEVEAVVFSYGTGGEESGSCLERFMRPSNR